MDKVVHLLTERGGHSRGEEGRRRGDASKTKRETENGKEVRGNVMGYDTQLPVSRQSCQGCIATMLMKDKGS